MKLIKTSYQILNPTGYTIKDIYKSIEYASRTCYKSEESITDNSADKFVKMIIDRGHTAMLEHGTVYLIVPAEWQGRSEKENC
ncbi:FAD-dependent thymidylate synthase [Clostridium sp.]|uniref:FAD-dependent thymidylate synthase n=1 Tax=Clostridium sp. TaxID=1506 RepID=UPI002FCB4DEB